MGGLVTWIATYHYFRIFNSWNDAFDVKFSAKEGGYVVSLTGAPFNDAYRYVDWVLTVPLLLIELILVMGLPAEETVSKSWKLGVASAAMVALGYPGEIQDSASGRWMWWFFAMLPFLYVVAGLAATAGEQIGYSCSDVLAKAVFGVLIWAIASEKSKLEGGSLAELNLRETFFSPCVWQFVKANPILSWEFASWKTQDWPEPLQFQDKT